jgi:hypothetical protein
VVFQLLVERGFVKATDSWHATTLPDRRPC